MTTTTKPYELPGRVCSKCGSTGPFLLDPSDDFTIDDDGEIRFPPGEWGLDIDCDCAACGFAARLGDFCTWVEVTGEDRIAFLRDFPKSPGRDGEEDHDSGPRLARVLAGYGGGDPRANLIDLMADAMDWCSQRGHDFDSLLATAVGRFRERDGKNSRKTP